MLRIWKALPLLLVLGCHSWREIRRQELTTYFDSLIGTDIRGLVAEWGPPSNVFPNGDVTIYTWNRTGDTHVSTFSGSGSAWTEECQQWFEVDAGYTVVHWHFRGQC